MDGDQGQGQDQNEDQRQKQDQQQDQDQRLRTGVPAPQLTIIPWMMAVAEDIDVLAAHVVIKRGGGERHGKDVWYLLPVEALEGVKSLRFFPGLKGRDPRWEKYREAWEWLEGKQT